MAIKIRQLPDTDHIVQAIKKNDGYCVCSIDKTEDTKCMCKEFKYLETGICHCGLYEKIKY